MEKFYEDYPVDDSEYILNIRSFFKGGVTGLVSGYVGSKVGQATTNDVGYGATILGSGGVVAIRTIRDYFRGYSTNQILMKHTEFDAGLMFGSFLGHGLGTLEDKVVPFISKFFE